MFGLYCTVGALLGAPAQAPATPDALYAARESLANVEAAAKAWRAQPAGDFDAAWKLARANYWIGGHADTEDRRRTALEAGVAAGTRAVAINASRPEGYFWRAANMGALAESFGIMQGLKYRGRIKDDLEKVLAMDAGWQQGSADRALGRWYDKVPGLFGGSDDKAEAHYRASLKYNPDSTASLFFLAELLLDRKRAGEATSLLQHVLDAPLDPEWTPEDKEFKAKAAALCRDRKLTCDTKQILLERVR
jgi:hypothetical protein